MTDSLNGCINEGARCKTSLGMSVSRCCVALVTLLVLSASSAFAQAKVVNKSIELSHRSDDSVQVRVYWVDDSVQVSLNGTPTLTKSFSNTLSSANLTSSIQLGANTIVVDLTNTGAGWSLKWDLLVNGVVVVSENCGASWNSDPGCLNDDQTLGLVYRYTVTLQSTPSITPTQWTAPSEGSATPVSLTAALSAAWSSQSVRAVRTLTDSFYSIYGMAVDATGKVYATAGYVSNGDHEGNNVNIYSYDPITNTKALLAGSGAAGATDGFGSAASFGSLYGDALAMGSDGYLYVADRYNHLLRRVDTTTGEVVTVAGSTQGFADGVGSAVQFDQPHSIAADDAGHIYVADYSKKVRIFTIADGTVTSLTVTGALWNFATGLEYGSDGRLYWMNGVLYVIDLSTGASSPFAGGFDAPHNFAASHSSPFLYVADTRHSVIKRVSLADGSVETFAGAGVEGNKDGLAQDAWFQSPSGIVEAPDGTVLVGSYSPGTIRAISLETASWLSTTPSSGSGNALIDVTAAATNSVASRYATLSIGGALFSAIQAGIAPALFTVSPTTWSAPAAGGTQVVTVSANAVDASWTATSNQTWLTLSALGGKGDGSVTLIAASTTSVNPRTAVVTIAGQQVTVTQAGLTPTFTVSPTTWSAPAAGGTQVVTVSANAVDASWTATSDQTWLTLSDPGGTGDGSVTLIAASTTSVNPRTAVVTIAGQQVTVTQLGGVLSVKPKSVSVGAAGGSTNVAVTVNPTSVIWSVSVSADWISTNVSGGEGNRAVEIRVQQNTTKKVRTGSVTIGATKISVKQAQR